ncbi:hypothetical protein LOK46_22475 [Methylobacterium sp. NMS14P]|uniref:hypothetical protein n=1 Tax=Methylobacterium sp. NMS14P TaxID=2894310 RepID=UPI0023590513|nr:hypothetical protein [Methylobacterium sp. NMS14P]WCS23891.1 hypothetical protein LOK46_22475 [Methylobacterium sp. NMS14P]
MKALVSGQAGLAVVLGDTPEFRPVGSDPYPANDEAIFRALEGFSDIKEIIVPDDDVRKLDSIVTKAWAEDKAIYQLYMLFDMSGTNTKLENSIVDKFRSILTQYEVAGAIGEWLSGVNLGPKYIERAKYIAAKYPDLNFVITHLYPGLDVRNLSPEGLAGQNSKISQHKTKPLRTRAVENRYLPRRADDRPDTWEERRALQILMPIIQQARLPRLGVPSARVNLKASRFGFHGKKSRRSSFQYILQLTAAINRAIYKERLDSVKPYTTGEVSRMVRQRHMHGESVKAEDPIIKKRLQQGHLYQKNN